MFSVYVHYVFPLCPLSYMSSVLRLSSVLCISSVLCLSSVWSPVERNIILRKFNDYHGIPYPTS
jgi:hypothetical protein